jgi:hypothetical protein
MSRIHLLLALTLALTLAAIPAALHAQGHGMHSFSETSYPPPNTTPNPPLLPDFTPSPRFPITVRLQQESLSYHWTTGSFIAHGQAHIFNPTGEDAAYSYNCGVTFDTAGPNEFYARFRDHNRKLQIVLRDPDTDRTHTCTLRLTPHNTQQAAVHP